MPITEETLRKAESILGHVFRDRSILTRSLVHASHSDSRLESNERLEFLGDSVLGLVVCRHLHEEYPELLEGEMTKIKSTVVSRHTCADIAEALELGELLRLGKGMGGRRRLPRSVAAAALEALIGAVFLDGGLEAASRFVLGQLEPLIAQAADSGHQSNFKSVLQQAAQQRFDMTPMYVVLDEKGPDHAKCFEVCVDIGPRRFSSCWGASKKQAEQDAALTALVELGLAERDDDGVVHLLDEEGAWEEAEYEDDVA